MIEIERDLRRTRRHRPPIGIDAGPVLVNGVAWSLDTRTMSVADSRHATLSCDRTMLEVHDAG
jgi:hypothetical protein